MERMAKAADEVVASIAGRAAEKTDAEELIRCICFLAGAERVLFFAHLVRADDSGPCTEPSARCQAVRHGPDKHIDF